MPEADVYVLKLILHDWNDDECVQSCRPSPATRARTVACSSSKHLFETRTVTASTLDLGALMDMTLLVMMSGRERILPDYDALFARGGWTRRDLQPSRSIYSFLELAPASQS